MIAPPRLLDVQRNIRELPLRSTRSLRAGDEPDAAWFENLLADRVTADDVGYWLLVSRATQDRTIGVVEAWLDNPAIDEELRVHLIALLQDRLEAGEGAELDGDALEALIADLLGRTIAPRELLGGERFVLSVLDLTDGECPLDGARGRGSVGGFSTPIHT